MTRWSELPGADEFYLRTFPLPDPGATATLSDADGEARACARLVPAGARVLDAGCGHGRVAAALARHGYLTVGVDVDERLLEIARELLPELDWRIGDLADPDTFAELGAFDLVVAAGNVIPLVAAGTEATVISYLSGSLLPGGLLVCGFGLDAAHLPLAQAPFGLSEYDAWCAAAGLQPAERWSTWDGDPYRDGGYVVTVHQSR